MEICSRDDSLRRRCWLMVELLASLRRLPRRSGCDNIRNQGGKQMSRKSWKTATRIGASMLLLAGIGVLSAPSYSETDSKERRDERQDTRQDVRDTRQTGRESARDAKEACKEGDEKSRAECRKEKRDTKQGARDSAREKRQGGE